jgi:hypothetical protein
VTLWASRDEPVLRYLAEHPPPDGAVWVNRMSEQPRAGLRGLTDAEFFRAIEMLGDAGYIVWRYSEGSGGGEWVFTDVQVTGTGKQVLGLWPRFDALGSPGELAALLEALAYDAPTEEERTNLQRAATAVRRSAPDVLRSLMAGALGAVARSQLGL